MQVSELLINKIISTRSHDQIVDELKSDHAKLNQKLKDEISKLKSLDRKRIIEENQNLGKQQFVDEIRNVKKAVQEPSPNQSDQQILNNFLTDQNAKMKKANHFLADENRNLKKAKREMAEENLNLQTTYQELVKEQQKVKDVKAELDCLTRSSRLLLRNQKKRMSFSKYIKAQRNIVK